MEHGREGGGGCRFECGWMVALNGVVMLEEGEKESTLTSPIHARSERYSPATRAAVIPPPDNAQDMVLGRGDVGGGCTGE